MSNWDEQIVFPAKHPDIEYAYILKYEREPVICTKEELYKLLSRNTNVKFIATPEYDHFFIPGTDFETLEYVKEAQKPYYRLSIAIGTIFIVVAGGTFLLDFFTGFDSPPLTGLLFFAIAFGVIPLISGIVEMKATRTIIPEKFIHTSNSIKFDFWLWQKIVPWSFLVTGVLLFLAVIQYKTDLEQSILTAGLVKPLVFEGEYWRLLTGILLHGNITHLFLNSIAIFYLSFYVIRLTNFSFFAIVFLLSGITGSIFSLYLMPNATSVGASGGIMGLIGFLVVISAKFKRNVPRSFLINMIGTIFFIAVVGIVGYEFIDNAAHAGGLIAGMVLGLILIKRKDNFIPYKPSIYINILGVIATVILIYGIVLVFQSLKMQ